MLMMMMMLMCQLRGEDREADANTDTGSEANDCDHHVKILRETGRRLNDGRQNNVRTIQN